MLLLLLLSVLCFFTCIVLGDSFILAFTRKSIVEYLKYSIADKFWIGLALCSGIVTLLSIFVAINEFVLLLFIAVSLLLGILRRKSLYRELKDALDAVLCLSIFAKILLICVFVVLVLFGVTACIHLDYGSYHLQVVKWTSNFSLVPGLGNLHSRYAFNSSFFNLCALFCYQPKLFPPVFYLNVLSYSVYAVWLIQRIDSTNKTYHIGAYMFLLLSPLCIEDIGNQLSSTSTDVLVGLLIVYLLVEIVTNKNILSDKPLLIMLLPLFCITLKLSSFLVVILIIALVWQLLKSKNFRKISLVFLIGALFILPWLVRNVVLSGYLIYPMYSIDLFDFDWKMPISMLTDELNIVESWTKIPFASPDKVLKMHVWEWGPVWLKSQSYFTLFLCVMMLISIVLLSCKINILKKTKKINIVVILIAFLGVVLFCNTPSVRFSYGFIISFIILPFLFLPDKKLSSPLKYMFYIVLCLALALYVLPIGVDRLLGVKRQRKETVAPFYLLWEPQRYIDNPPNVRPIQLEGGEVLYIGECYDQVLPCAMFFNEGIEFRGESLQDGFRIKKGYNPRGGLLTE